MGMILLDLISQVTAAKRKQLNDRFQTTNIKSAADGLLISVVLLKEAFKLVMMPIGLIKRDFKFV
jgi:hypothetical protein